MVVWVEASSPSSRTSPLRRKLRRTSSSSITWKRIFSMAVRSFRVAVASERAECSREMVSTLTMNRAIMIATIAPNPENNFLPIVISKSLHLPRALWPLSGLQVPRLAGWILELELDDFHGVFRSRLEFPFFHGIYSGRDEYRTSSHNFRVAHLAVRRDGHFHFYFPGDAHPSRELWILGSHARFHFAFC